MGLRLRCKDSWIPWENCVRYPGYQRFFSRAAGIFGVGRRPKPRAATALEKSLAPRLCVRWLATCFAALLRNGFKSYVALFTTYVQTRLHKAGCCKLRDYWRLIFSQPPTTFWFVSRQVWFVSGQTRNIAIQLARFAAIMLHNKSHVFVACFTVPLLEHLVTTLRLCSHHTG